MIDNPFSIIDRRLNKIESILLEIKNENQVGAPKETLLTEEQAAFFLNISLADLQSLKNKSLIPVRVKGNPCYYSHKDLEAWRKKYEKETI